ncbi:MAG: response regulator transcription factor [Phototrophicaceae bacterium]
MIQVALVDDHHVVRRGIESFLTAMPDMKIVGSAESGEMLLEHLESWLPDVIVMDLYMPGGIDGIETTRQLRAISPHTQVVVLTAHTDDERVIAALRAGAIGYIRKESDPLLLVEAIRGANNGQSVIDPAVASAVLRDMTQQKIPGIDLTERENEILLELAHGLSNKEIAEKLVIGTETVKTHVGNILSKLHLKHRHQALVYALKNGLISLDELEL